MTKVITPYDVMVETVALELAAVFYEIGRGQGLTSKHKDAKAYAKANLEKFLGKAVEHLIECLGPNSTLPLAAKEEIYNCLASRVNDPDTDFVLPDINVRKVLAATETTPINRLSQFLEPKPKVPDIRTALKDTTAVKATRH